MDQPGHSADASQNYHTNPDRHPPDCRDVLVRTLRETLQFAYPITGDCYGRRASIGEPVFQPFANPQPRATVSHSVKSWRDRNSGTYTLASSMTERDAQTRTSKKSHVSFSPLRLGEQICRVCGHCKPGDLSSKQYSDYRFPLTLPTLQVNTPRLSSRYLQSLGEFRPVLRTDGRLGSKL
jgi:hypothetical protein